MKTMQAKTSGVQAQGTFIGDVLFFADILPELQHRFRVKEIVLKPLYFNLRQKQNTITFLGEQFL